MFAMLAASAAESAAAAQSLINAAPGGELARGAIAGAFIVGAAFLAGTAAIKRSGLALCALFLVIGAGALQFSAIGLAPAITGNVYAFGQALFAALILIFLSASIGAARNNAVLGGLMFSAALVIAGMGLINFVGRINVTPLIEAALIGVGGFAVLLSVMQTVKGDAGARLILPGVLLAAAAPFVGALGIGEATGVSMLSQGLFALGVLGASTVALTETPVSGTPALRPAPDLAAFATEPAAPRAATIADIQSHAGERDEIVLDSQIARVLDYSGVAIWDWGPEGIDQTESLPSLLGADSTAPFTPESLRNFIHDDDAARFEAEVLSPIDGPFDSILMLFDGRKVRLRGARAANEVDGSLERIVAFIETATPLFTPSKNNGVEEKTVRKATEAAIVPAATSAAAVRMAEALDKGEVRAAFQPIVSLGDNKTVGYEALARWRDDETTEPLEALVQAAESAGKGMALAQQMLSSAGAYLADKLKADRKSNAFVAINCSWGQMRDPAFAEMVKETIETYALPKKALVLELTEADAVSDEALAGNIFKALTDAGAALAFDDFGAGFTCLSNLKKFDFDYIKIDKSFTADLDANGDGAKIVTALAGLGKDLGLKVIIEGVETKRAAKAAQEAGCAMGQGFLFGAPEESTLLEAPSLEQKSETPRASLESDNDDDTIGDLADTEETPSENAEASEDKPVTKTPRWRMWRSTADLR